MPSANCFRHASAIWEQRNRFQTGAESSEYATDGEGLLSEVLTVINRSDMIADCISVISGEGTHWTLRDQSVSIRKSRNDVHVLRDMRVSFGTSHLALGNRPYR